jgi:2-polyprenyl-6-methoxyphenol hydroxylase-like FAD-dependent oxidoreductase
MAVEESYVDNSRLPESNQVIVVGAGPVGLIASLLLSKYHIPHVLVEQLNEPDNHHWKLIRACSNFRMGTDQSAFAK